MKLIKITSDTFISGNLIVADPDKVHELEDSIAQTLVAASKAEYYIPLKEEKKESIKEDKSEQKKSKMNVSKKKKRKER